MRRPGNLRLYAQMRAQYLRAAEHHRRCARRRGLVGELHARELTVCQRQLGALRQAYRRTQEALAWEAYKRAVEDPG